MKFIPVNVPKLHRLEKKYINECISTNWISSGGKFVSLFEKNFAKYNKRKYGIAVSSGTAALEIAIKSLNLKKNSEVIIPAFSIISTALAVVKNNLKPVLVDCDIDTWNVNPEEVIKKITKKTSAIILTHIYGLPVDLRNILKKKKKKKTKIVEDAAEVIGLNYNNKICGSFGDISIFSFYANKHITTGEGGMILTNDPAINEKSKSLRNLSFSKSYFDRFNHTDLGWNYRLTNLQAAIGCGQLEKIKWIVKKKREVGNKYFKKLNNLKNILLQKKITKYAKNIYWVFGLVLKNTSKYSRDEIMRKLLKMKIETRPFFLPMHKQTIFKKMNLFKNIKLPNAEFISKNGFYIPSGIGIKDKEINFVINNLKKILH